MPNFKNERINHANQYKKTITKVIIPSTTQHLRKKSQNIGNFTLILNSILSFRI